MRENEREKESLKEGDSVERKIKLATAHLGKGRASVCPPFLLLSRLLSPSSTSSVAASKEII